MDADRRYRLPSMQLQKTRRGHRKQRKAPHDDNTRVVLVRRRRRIDSLSLWFESQP